MVQPETDIQYITEEMLLDVQRRGLHLSSLLIVRNSADHRMISHTVQFSLLMVVWMCVRCLTSRSETHVLLPIKNEASHWLAIWTVSCTLTYCKRRGETRLSVLQSLCFKATHAAHRDTPSFSTSFNPFSKVFGLAPLDIICLTVYSVFKSSPSHSSSSGFISETPQFVFGLTWPVYWVEGSVGQCLQEVVMLRLQELTQI